MKASTPKKSGKPGKPGRPTDPRFYPGARFGHLEIKRKLHLKTGLHYDCICHAPTKVAGVKCMKVHRVRPAYLVRPVGPTTNCGCLTYIEANPYPREKGIWTMMHMRTEDPRHVSYKDYGGKGIKVCAEWNKSNPHGWFNFINYMGGAPTKKHSIDRINPFLGYQPYQEDGVTPQCRWATSTEQANNQRRHWNKK